MRPPTIGGTDIGPLLGATKYKSPADVWRRIMNGEEAVTDPGQLLRMARGTREEPNIRRLFVEGTGAEIEPHPGIVTSHHYPFAHVSPDDIAILGGKRTAVDYKSVLRWAAIHRHIWGEEGSDVFPEPYFWQLAWSMALTGCSESILFAAFGDDNEDFTRFDIKFCRMYRLTRDPETEAAMLSVAADWWAKHIVTGICPAETPKATKRKKPKATMGAAQ